MTDKKTDKDTKTVQEFDRIPVTKTAAMRYILEQVEKGFRYYCQGVCPIEKAEALADKFAFLYGTRKTKNQLAYAAKKGEARCKLVMYPDNTELSKAKNMLWWLLVSEGEGDVWDKETLKDTWKTRLGWLRLFPGDPDWVAQYILTYKQIPAEKGGGWAWTWAMSKTQKDQIQAEMQKRIFRAISSSSDKPKADKTRSQAVADRITKKENTVVDLLKLVASFQKLPGFRGIRDNKREILNSCSKFVKSLTSQIDLRYFFNLGTWVDKSLTIFEPGRTLPAVVQQWRDLQAGGLAKEKTMFKGKVSSKNLDIQQDEWSEIDVL